MTARALNLREILGRLRLTQTKAAALIGVSPRTVRGWLEPYESPGHRAVPAPVWLLFELIEHVPGVLEHLKDLAADG